MGRDAPEEPRGARRRSRGRRRLRSRGGRRGARGGAGAERARARSRRGSRARDPAGAGVIRAAPAVIAAWSLAACANPPAASRAPLSPEVFRAGLSRLAESRRLGAQARTDRITLELVEPRTGRVLRARGAVAID